jgi:hypothetical protein
MKLALDNKFKRKLNARFSGYEFEVGVLQDRRHRAPLPLSRGLKTFMGGPARKISNQSSGNTVAEISSGFQASDQYLTKPFQRTSPELKLFTQEAVKFGLGRSTRKKVEHALQKTVIVPILKQKYGSNSFRRVLEKGFNRYMIETGQFVRAILARVRRV